MTFTNLHARLRLLFALTAIFSLISVVFLFALLNNRFKDDKVEHVSNTADILELVVPETIRVVFFLDGFDADINRMRAGGVGGEIRLFKSLMNVIREIPNARYQLISFIDQSTEKALRDADLIFSDQYHLASLTSIIPDALGDPDIACRLRFIDFWGTPPEQNHIHLNLKQFLVPYPNEWNEFLGFSQDPISPILPNATHSKLLLHGKHGRYFQDHLHIIEALSENYTVMATVPSAQLDGIQFPTNVVNYGICSATDWNRLLSESSAVIGFGDPVLAPTALEAVAAGSPYIFAKYTQPRSLFDLPAHPIQTQHDFMMKIGPPYAYAIDIGNLQDVQNTVRLSIRNSIDSWIPEPYMASQYLNRVQDILRKDLCQQI